MQLPVGCHFKCKLRKCPPTGSVHPQNVSDVTVIFKRKIERVGFDPTLRTVRSEEVEETMLISETGGQRASLVI